VLPQEERHTGRQELGLVVGNLADSEVGNRPVVVVPGLVDLGTLDSQVGQGILFRDLLEVEVGHIDLPELEGHRTAVLLVAEDLQDSRLELGQQPAV
jgi:hypothetical protein